MIGILFVCIAISLTVIVLWKPLTLFILAAAGFWIASLAYLLNVLSSDVMRQEAVLAIGAIIFGLLLWGMVGRQPAETKDSGGSFRRFIRRMNGENVYRPRPHPETEDEYRLRVNKALHPNRIPRR